VSTGAEILRDYVSSQADPRDLAETQLTPLRELFEETTGFGLWAFAISICGLTKLTPHLHFEMCQVLSRWGEPDWRRIMLMVPRGCFKTSIGSKALPLWIATKDPEATVGMFNAAHDQSKSWVGAIRSILEASHLYHRLWPHRLPRGITIQDRDKGLTLPKSWHWGDSGLRLVRESAAVSEDTFEPYGIGGASTGRHYSHRIMDDLIGEVAATSPLLIEDAIHFVDHARALEQPPNGGCELVCCTPWAYRDCYSHLLQKWGPEYQLYRRSLLENPRTGEPDTAEGESIFPEAITTHQAREMHERDPFVFSSQYQCIPRSGRDTAFSREWLRPVQVVDLGEGELELRIPEEHFDPRAVCSAVSEEDAPDRIGYSWCDRALLIDPAPTKKGEKTNEPRARTGLVVVALDPWGRYHTLQSVALREDPVTILESVVQLSRIWKFSKVGIEEVNFSSVYAPLWQQILHFKHPDVEFRWVSLFTKGEDKDTRIRALMGPHREALWYYSLPDTRTVVQELLEYPNSETRDCLDAQAYFRQILVRPETPDERALDRHRRSDGRDQYTGY
jgi:hypothetical protein